MKLSFLRGSGERICANVGQVRVQGCRVSAQDVVDGLADGLEELSVGESAFFFGGDEGAPVAFFIAFEDDCCTVDVYVQGGQVAALLQGGRELLFQTLVVDGNEKAVHVMKI